MEYTVGHFDVVIVSVLVLYLGVFLTKKIPFLFQNNIPAAVTGGFVCSIIVAAIYVFLDIQINFDMQIRDTLLLVFFSTIGLGAKLKTLMAGGKALVLLLVLTVIFLLLQNITGVSIALLFDANPVLGLFGGTISFAGGHGTTIAWGELVGEAGLPQAKELGIACATFGLIMGGVIGGPLAGRLIKKHKLKADKEQNTLKKDPTKSQDVTKTFDILNTLLVLAICVEVGSFVNRILVGKGVMLPGFLTSMMVGIVITNLEDFSRFKLNHRVINAFSDISLQIFLTISLMSMQLASLAQAAGPILIVVFAQAVLITFFASFIIFRVLGKNYDAAVISGGFAGLGLGATPVAIANISSITGRFGPSPKAFLVVPLVGAFFVDIANAFVIKLFLGAPVIKEVLQLN